MDEGKKSEASGEELEQLGLYRLQEQVPQSDDSQGECYLATHETSGATALVRKRTAEEDAAQRSDLRLLFSSSPSLGYDAMQVEDTPWSVAPDRQSAESLLFTLEELHAAVRRMAGAVSDSREPRPRWGSSRTSSPSSCARRSPCSDGGHGGMGYVVGRLLPCHSSSSSAPPCR
jgi:hypothetical protein